MSISIHLLKRFSLFGVLWFIHVQAFSQNTIKEFTQMQSLPLVYQVLKTNEPLTIDGKDHDSIWSGIPWSSSFIDIEGNNQPLYDTKFKMVYDDQYLYLFTKMEEPHIWGDITEHDAIIYHNNDFEIFLKPDVHEDHYFELEINVLNTLFDLLMPRPYRFGGKAQIHWDTKGIKTAVHHEGTANNPNDTDQYWSVEMAIPFDALRSFGSPRVPVTDSYWLINFSRVQWQYEIENNTYKRKSANNRLLPEDNWVWSPVGLINMHYPERWGYVQFVDTLTTPKLPDFYEIKKIGWNIHYLQQIYRQENHLFPEELARLPKYNDYIKPFLAQYQIAYVVNKDFSIYSLSIHEKDTKRSFFIDNFGNNKYHAP